MFGLLCQTGSGIAAHAAVAIDNAKLSMDILRDGFVNLRGATTDLMDEQPKKTTNSKEHDPLPGQIARHFESFDWVDNAEVRMREEGHVIFGEASLFQNATMVSSRKLLSYCGAPPDLIGAGMI